MVTLCGRIARDVRFQRFITVVIILAGGLVGLETYPVMEQRYGTLLHFLDKVVLWIFVVEISIKLVAEWPRPQRFFRDSWNVFDFVVVSAAFMPLAGQYATVLRLLRLLRVLRLVRALPRLQLLVGALLKSIPSMAYVSVLLLLLFYIYAVAAVFLWGGNDPVHFKDLQTSFLSLFRVATLEDWTDIMYINMYGCDRYGYSADSVMPCTTPSASPLVAALFFVSFVLTGTMIILNLFIGVIMNGMDEAQAEAADQVRADAPGAAPTPSTEVAELQLELAAMQARLGALGRLLEKPPE
jgi:voltage-gated sodium channel